MTYKIITLKRVEQAGAVECGPASVCILLSLYPEFVDTFSIVTE